MSQARRIFHYIHFNSVTCHAEESCREVEEESCVDTEIGHCEAVTEDVCQDVEDTVCQGGGQTKIIRLKT